VKHFQPKKRKLITQGIRFVYTMFPYFKYLFIIVSLFESKAIAYFPKDSSLFGLGINSQDSFLFVMLNVVSPWFRFREVWSVLECQVGIRWYHFYSCTNREILPRIIIIIYFSLNLHKLKLKRSPLIEVWNCKIFLNPFVIFSKRMRTSTTKFNQSLLTAPSSTPKLISQRSGCERDYWTKLDLASKCIIRKSVRRPPRGLLSFWKPSLIDFIQFILIFCFNLVS
jgi:hypothetical protein